MTESASFSPSRLGRALVSVGAAAILSLLASHASAVPPIKASDPVPSPGKAIASDDDASAIAVNPANLAFVPAPEIRWTIVQTGSTSPFPNRGNSLDAALPFWKLATGLRVDWLDPPAAAPAPFNDSYSWIRWALALRAGDAVAIGSTFGWSSSDAVALDDAFSFTTGLTVRPFPFLSLAAVARDLNEPETRTRDVIERSYDFGLAIRPVNGRRGLEIGLETAFYETSDEWVPRATVGLDVPRVGRLRGDVKLTDLGSGTNVLATAGLDLNVGLMQLSGGGVFGNALSGSGAGFYAGAALRAYREPGAHMRPNVVKLLIDSTPGVRGHTRLLQKLWRLAQDPEVSGVLMVMRDEPASTLAHAEELGDAVRAIRAAGKKVMCHLEDAGGKSLYVCAQGDRIAMNPAGGLRFAGLSSRYFYFGGLLEKLGVRADFVRIGDHKLAAEQFAREGGSKVASEDHQSLVDQVESVYLHDVGGGRGIATDELKRRLARGPFLASEAKAADLIDTLAYQDEIERMVEEVMGGPVAIIDDDPPEVAPDRWGNLPKIALVYLSGDMVDGESQSIPFVGVTLAGSVTIANALKRAREDKTVRAVVFRIETGGGSSLAADVILREAILTAQAKPLIVSMGSSAASGGYYAAVAGETIFANRTTITGSIGIFYGKVDLVGLLDKLGVKSETFRSSPRADAESLFRPFTDDEHRELGVKVKQFYDLFIGRVAEGRGMTPEKVDSVARGKVWTGAQAKPLHLVDRLGGLREALDEARLRGGLPADAPIVESPDEDSSLLGLAMSLAGVSAAGMPGVTSIMIPPALMDLARAMTPFFVFESSKPLAHIEIVEDMSFGKPSRVTEP